MNGISSLAYSLAMIVAFALIAGGLVIGLKRKDWKRGSLMLLGAVVLIMNVLIWTLPLPQ